MEITYEIEVEAEDTPVRGNFMSTEDPEQDRRDEDALIARLNRGEVEAWCVVKCTARIGEFSHTEYLGGCSLDKEYTAEVCVEEHGMKEEARTALLVKINDLHRMTDDILKELAS